MKSSAAKTHPPRQHLHPYQERWVADDARFKIACKARQIGFTFAAAYRVVRQRLQKPGLTVWLSASQRQSNEAMEHVRRFVQAVEVVADYEEIEFSPDVKKLEVRFRHNGSRIIALPANPDTARGFAGDMVLDEFAFHRDADAIWRAAFATVSRGYSLEIISTPTGRLGKYYDLARAAGLVEPAAAQKATGQWQAGAWSAHWCDIHQAVADGCPVNVEELRAAVGDHFTWEQEYCCVFASDADSLIPLTDIAPAEDPAVFCGEFVAGRLPAPALLLGSQSGPDSTLYLGADIGRRRDLTVIWTLGGSPSHGLWTSSGVAALRAVPFSQQREFLEALLPHARRACIDSTGLGLQMAEELEQRWGPRVEPVHFTLAVKEDLAMRVLRAFAERQLKIPFAPWVRGGLSAVKRYLTAAGNVRYDAARTEEGHADAFWALGLALHAARSSALSTDYLDAGRPSAGAWMGGGSGIARQIRAAW